MKHQALLPRLSRPWLPLWLLLTTSLFLNGCSSLLKPNDTEQLTSLNHWDVAGKISIKTPDNAATGFLSWNQNTPDYQIFITGPLLV